jgi:hypothetical protein
MSGRQGRYQMDGNAESVLGQSSGKPQHMIQGLNAVFAAGSVDSRLP